MEFFRKIVTGMIVVTFPFNFVYAGTTPAERFSLADFIKEAKSHPQPKDFLEAIKSKIPKEAYDGMKAHLKDFGKELMPHMKMDGDDTLVLEFKGRMIPMRVLSATHQVFLINNKPVDFSHAVSFDERLSMVKQALPQDSEKHGSWFQLIPEAKADDSLQRLQGPVVGGAGVGALVAVGVELGVMSLWMIPGVALVIAGYVLWDAGVCDTIKTQFETCQRERDILEARIRKDAKLLNALKSHSDRACENHEEQDEKDNAIAEKLMSFVHGVDETSRQLATCRNNMNGLKLCTADYTLDAYYSCVNFAVGLGEYMAPWAKEKFEAGLPKPLSSTIK